MLLGSLMFSACSDDEGTINGDGSTIVINGVEYPISPYVEMRGGWDEDSQSGDFTVTVDVNHNGVIDVDYYRFRFSNSTCPAAGDNFASMRLVLIPMIGSSDDIEMEDYTYESGSAVVTETNPGNSEITIRFDDLKMVSRGNESFTFDGTATLMFTYDGW